MDGVELAVRRITVGDWPEYRRLRLEALAESPTAFLEQYDESVRRPDGFWQDRARRAAAGATVASFVAMDGATMVGNATGIVEADVPDLVSAQVVGVYVSPAFRGPASRAAERVVAAVVRWAAEEVRAARIRLFVTDDNQRALAFYQRMGFRLTGVSTPYPPEPALNELEMVHGPGSG